MSQCDIRIFGHNQNKGIKILNQPSTSISDMNRTTWDTHSGSCEDYSVHMDLIEYGDLINSGPEDYVFMTISEMQELLSGCQTRFENLGRRL